LTETDWLLLGDITSVHGIKGGLKVRCNTNNLNVFGKLKSIRLKKKGVETDHQISSLRIDRNFLIVTLADVIDRNSAESLVGSQFLAVKQETAKLPQDEWWIKDLIGLSVFSADGKLIGTVSDIITSAQDLLEITPADKSKKETILVPLVKELVPVVDMQAKRIEIADLPGLLDDN
jgi:16S rRNA processing protein RimM